jgi:hypothetical protein
MSPELHSLDGEMTELSLLLPRVQALALIDAAQEEGISVAQLLRRLVRQVLDAPPLEPRFSAN